MLAWDSMAEREKRWGAFLADPEWVAVVAKTEKDGQLVEGEGWPARREHQQPVAGASLVFCREVRLWMRA